MEASRFGFHSAGDKPASQCSDDVASTKTSAPVTTVSARPPGESVRKNKREEEEEEEDKSEEQMVSKKKSKSPQQIEHIADVSIARAPRVKQCKRANFLMCPVPMQVSASSLLSPPISECQKTPVPQGADNEASKGERSRRRSSFMHSRVRKSLPPIIQHGSEFWHVIKQDIPENQRLKKLLETILEHHSQRIQTCFADTPEFDFAAYQSEAMQIEKNLAAMDEEGLFISCVKENTRLKEDILANVNTGDEEASEEIKADILNLMRQSSAWDDLLKKQQQRTLAAVSQAAQDPGLVEPGPSSSSGVGDLASVLAKKPDYEALLTSLPNLANTAELMIDRLQSCQSKLLHVTAKAGQYLQVTTGSLRHAALHRVDASWDSLLQSPSDASSRFFTIFRK
uniref:Uncharacterized protein n=1 Tax=Eptatretus burgeri TaxID=7764 RepID=A0A8C4QIW8_EPTBU